MVIFIFDVAGGWSRMKMKRENCRLLNKLEEGSN